MGSEWASLTIGDLVREGEASVQTGPFGSQLHSHDYVDSGTAVIPTEAIGRGRILDIKVPRVDAAKASELSRHRLRLGDILFARRGAQATGLSAIVDERFEGALCGTGALLLRVQSTRVDPRYLSMFLSSEAAYVWLRTHAVGAVMPNLNTAIIQALPISLPRIHEQQRIAGFIGALDNRITLLRETNATLEAIAQALFKSWFVDFDPVRAKMEGRTPEGMDEATAALFPDGFETSELGEVPRGWRVGTLSDIAFLNAQSWTVRNAPSEVAYVDLAGVKSNVFDEPQSYAFSAAPSRARRVLRTGDCIVGTVRPGNRSFGFIAHANNNLTGSTGFAVLSPKQKEMTAFVYLGATREDNIDRLSSLADGGAYPAVKPELVVATTCVLPTDSVMQEFDEVARPLLDSIGSNSAQAQSLASLRNTLLPRLISGQLLATEARKETNIY